MMSIVKKKLGLDDALDVFACHGIGGIWGGIATGLFASKSVNEAVTWNGLVFGEWNLFAAQLLSILITIVIAGAGTGICVFAVKLFTSLRVTGEEEEAGLDKTQHGEEAYPAFEGFD